MRNLMIAMLTGAGLLSLAGAARAQSTPTPAEQTAPSSARGNESGATTAEGQPYSRGAESDSTGRTATPSGAATGIGSHDAPR